MLRLDADALACDMAEVYHVFDIKALSVATLARLSVGLRQNSRIKMKMRGDKLTFEEYLMVAILDDLRWLRWSKTKAAQKGADAPKSLLKELTTEENEDDVQTFSSPEEFMKKWNELNRR